MDESALKRLRYAAYGLLFVCLVILVHLLMGRQIPLNDAVSTLVLAAFALLAIAELGPIIQSLKFGGVEVKLREEISGEVARLDTRIADLERAVEAASVGGQEAVQAALSPSKREPAPALFRPVKVRNDPNKFRFGQEAARDGFRLEAAFSGQRNDWVDVLISITSDRGTASPRGEYAEIYLHPTFKTNPVRVNFDENGVAVFKAAIWGGFTIGVWLPVSQVELELDLAALENAPKIVKER